MVEESYIHNIIHVVHKTSSLLANHTVHEYFQQLSSVMFLCVSLLFLHVMSIPIHYMTDSMISFDLRDLYPLLMIEAMLTLSDLIQEL